MLHLFHLILPTLTLFKGAVLQDPFQRSSSSRSLEGSYKDLLLKLTSISFGSLGGLVLVRSWGQFWTMLAPSWSWKRFGSILDSPGKDASKMGPRGAKMAPRCGQEGPRSTQERLVGAMLGALWPIWGASWSYFGEKADKQKTLKNRKFL